MPSETPTTARGRETRERIVNATAELVAERGVAGTSLDDVRERGSFSKSQLYHYFTDRDDLLRAVAQATCDAVIDTQADALDAFDSYAGIERYLAATVELQIQREARGGCPIGSLAGQLAEQDENARQLLQVGMDRWQQSLCQGLERMASRGELRRDADPDLLATQILAVLQGGLLLTQLHRDPEQMRAAGLAVLVLVTDSLANNAKKATLK